MEDAVKDLGVLLDESGGTCEIGELPDVEANEIQMRQLFENLIGNALKYRGEQKPLIRIYKSLNRLSLSRDPCRRQRHRI